jgi:DNA-binding LacI/PurR family transcriptional regulator
MDRPKSEKRAGEVTSRHVARMLGVSQSMVSRAFDPNGRVAPANRARIIEAATALGYRPNVIARSLSTRRSGIVAIVMGGLENPFYADVLDELALRLDEAGFRSLLFRQARMSTINCRRFDSTMSMRWWLRRPRFRRASPTNGGGTRGLLS